MNSLTTLEKPLSARDFTLATDLDGTFLGGSNAAREQLYDWIEANRDSVGLIFVTGRDPDFIAEMCVERKLPWPDYVVGDVGTTIAEVRRPEIAPIVVLEQDISHRWQDAGERVRAALDGQPGLTLQPTEFRYRVSYDLDPAQFDARATAKVEALDLDWLISDNRYFDVLPKGVSKGPSIRRLVEHLEMEPSRVLVAGDTLNDLSMLTCGLPAVAVGNSEPDLMRQVRDLDHLYLAEAHGAGGIIEAIVALGLHPNHPKGA